MCDKLPTCAMRPHKPTGDNIHHTGQKTTHSTVVEGCRGLQFRRHTSRRGWSRGYRKATERLPRPIPMPILSKALSMLGERLGVVSARRAHSSP